MLKLIDADSKYLDQYMEAYQDSYQLVELGKMKKHNMMFLNPEEKDVVQTFMDSRDPSKLPEHYVPSYDYFAIDDDKLVGIIHIRIQLTEFLRRYGGHIGYAVSPKYFQMGYGTKILKLALEKYKDLILEDAILLTCDDDNIGSSKIIESNGGVLEDKIPNEDAGEKFLTRRYWIQK